ncbi:MAG: bifunctional phosphoribosylaminoimidazolecarboxamide formyltransferase/IMP cyclohydrolase [Candidatus Micrarchaeia archaeon]
MAYSRALISVFDKRGIEQFAKGLAARGIEILSTGGTSKALQEAGVPVRDVSDFTGFPELFNGRVKTIHPKIHGGILYRRDVNEHVISAKKHGIEPIDIVVVNLYPFAKIASQTDSILEDIIENIDIGGPALVRAAAKNYNNVLVITDPSDYESALEYVKSGSNDVEFRKSLMIKAFAMTSEYDWTISKFFGQKKEAFPEFLDFHYQRAYPLRYGENPHQKAVAYKQWGKLSIFDAKIYSGKQMSYNNFLDADTALAIIREFQDAKATVIVKHNNPCGGAAGSTLKESYDLAFMSDPGSAFGSVIAFSDVVDIETANAIGDRFVDVILAPGYDSDALLRLSAKPNRRILDISYLFKLNMSGQRIYRQVAGGILYQEADQVVYDPSAAKCVTKRAPSSHELDSMYFGTKFVKHTKSNALVFSTDRQLTGVGAGQMSRIDSCKLAMSKAKHDGFDLSKSVMSSDAYIPFRDVIDEIAPLGVKAVVQPGGSIRDQDVIDACNEYGIAMLFTGIRHFRH